VHEDDQRSFALLHVVHVDAVYVSEAMIECVGVVDVLHSHSKLSVFCYDRCPPHRPEPDHIGADDVIGLKELHD
jgi:hypothetical protein